MNVYITSLQIVYIAFNPPPANECVRHFPPECVHCF